MTGKPEYEVGYGRPPKATRFRKGVSGNPSGRSKKPNSMSALINAALSEKVVVKQNGRAVVSCIVSFAKENTTREQSERSISRMTDKENKGKGSEQNDNAENVYFTEMEYFHNNRKDTETYQQNLQML